MSAPVIKSDYKLKLKSKDEDLRESRKKNLAQQQKANRNSNIEEKRFGGDVVDSDFSSIQDMFNEPVDYDVTGDEDINPYVNGLKKLSSAILTDQSDIQVPSNEIQKDLDLICKFMIHARPLTEFCRIRGAQYGERSYPILNTQHDACKTKKAFLESDSLTNLLIIWQNIHKFNEPIKLAGYVLRVVSFLTSSIPSTPLFDESKWTNFCDLCFSAFLHEQFFTSCINAQSLLFFIHNSSILYPDTRKHLLSGNIMTILTRLSARAIDVLKTPGLRSPARTASVKTPLTKAEIEEDEKKKEDEDMFIFALSLAIKGLSTHFDDQHCDMNGINPTTCIELVTNLKCLLELTDGICREKILYAISSFSKSSIGPQVLDESFLLQLRQYIDADKIPCAPVNLIFLTSMKKVANPCNILLNVIDYPSLVVKLLTSSEETQADTITVVNYLLQTNGSQAANMLAQKPCFAKLLETLDFSAYRLAKPILFVLQLIVSNADASHSKFFLYSGLVSSIHKFLSHQDNDTANAILSIFEMLFERAKKADLLESFMHLCENEGAFSSIERAEDKFQNPLIARKFEKIRQFSDMAENSDREIAADNQFYSNFDEPDKITITI